MQTHEPGIVLGRNQAWHSNCVDDNLLATKNEVSRRIRSRSGSNSTIAIRFCQGILDLFRWWVGQETLGDHEQNEVGVISGDQLLQVRRLLGLTDPVGILNRRPE